MKVAKKAPLKLSPRTLKAQGKAAPAAEPDADDAPAKAPVVKLGPRRGPGAHGHPGTKTKPNGGHVLGPKRPD